MWPKKIDDGYMIIIYKWDMDYGPGHPSEDNGLNKDFAHV